MTKKIAFITGITGQDGAHLAKYLLEKNYNVHGLIRWDSFPDPMNGLTRLDEMGLVNDQITLHTGDLTDAQNITALIKKIQPNEIYNLAALSQVHVSFQTPASTFDINTKGTLHILEAVRILDRANKTRIYQASSSEMFGSSPAPQNETTPMEPCSPYGTAKLAAYWLAKNYRESYNMYIANGILFNHESPLRGEDFVTRKITKAVAEIESGRTEPLTLGNLDSIRDWGAAEDYMEGMWAMLQQKEPSDYVLATGIAKSVREFVTRAFAHIGITIDWQGTGLNEKGIDRKTRKILIQIDSTLFRPKEVHHLLGDSSKAQTELGWTPKTTFDKLISQMVNADRQRLWNLKNKDHLWTKQAG